MARFTTIVAVIGPDAEALVATVAHEATNVGAVLLRDFDADDARDRLQLAWRAAQRRKTIYTLTDFDPMQPIVDAWAARLRGEEHQLSLEVGFAEPTELPEYVMVSEEVDDETVHWYHGLIHGLAPRRVMTVTRSPDAIQKALERLRSDRPFPTADILSRQALDYSPTRLSGSTGAEQRGTHRTMAT